jgi:hypothetical protein
VCLARERPRRPRRLLRLPGGALKPSPYHQPDGEHVRHDPSAASPHEGKWLEAGLPRHDVQACHIIGTTLATPQRKPSALHRCPRNNLHRRSPAERRLINAPRTQHLTIALSMPGMTDALQRSCSVSRVESEPLVEIIDIAIRINHANAITPYMMASGV